MDEYFCPNCGAILNDQCGFDPECGSWTCTMCGMHLMDDDVYEGDLYEGVAWYCDSCGALLNRQSGFSDSCGYWICTECYHSNPINEDEIYVSEEDYQNSKAKNKIECPNCDCDLNDQYGFSENEYDWKCNECGANLHRDYFDEDFEVVEDDSYYECEDSDCSYSFFDNQKPSSKNTSNRTKKEKPSDRLSDKELRKVRIKAFLFKRKRIQIKYHYSDLIGKNFKEVEKLLHNLAFNNIKMIAIKDIYVDSSYNVGQVEQVVISGNSYFVAGELIPYDAEIIITYHLKKEITIPFAEKDLRKINYVDAGERLRELGFTEIYEKAIKDLIVGWVKKDGSVEKVTIGSMCPFRRNSVFPYDTKIVIEYHTFKRK